MWYTLFFLLASLPLFGSGYQPTSRERKSRVSFQETPAPVPIPLSKYATCFSHLEVGLNDSYTWLTPTSFARETGNLIGISGKYTYQAPDQVYAGVRALWSQGSLSGGGKSRSILQLLLEERIGYTWGSLRRGTFFSLFSGFGGRSFREFLKESYSNLTLHYLEWYFPVGFSWIGVPNDWFFFGILAEWMPQIYPTVNVSTLNGARWILNTELVNFLIQIPFGFKISRVSLVAEPFVELWHDGHVSIRSNGTTILYIPGNNYLFLGMNASISVAF